MQAWIKETYHRYGIRCEAEDEVADTDSNSFHKKHQRPEIGAI